METSVVDQPVAASPPAREVGQADVPQPVTATPSCCAPAKQAACCEPSEKAACCGEATSSGCGCQ